MEYLKELLSYDPEKGHLIWKVPRGNKLKAGDLAGSNHHSGYKEVQALGKVYRYHRVCWFLHYGKEPDKHIDHENGDRSDNRISNLRLVTNRENASNRDIHRNGKLIGACLNKRRNNWLSSIRIGSKNIFLGYYKTELEAHKMYLLAKENLCKYNGSLSMTMPQLRSLLKNSKG